MTNNVMNVENIIRPNGALTSLKSLLIPLYIQDYGIENKGIIYERLRNAIFIFDSDPIVTEKFVVEHLSEIKNSSFIRRTNKEYKDYLGRIEKVDKEINDMFEKYIFHRYYREALNHSIKMIDLDFDSFSLKNSQLLVCGDEKQRRLIEQRRKNYKVDCLTLGIDPIVNPKEIGEILYYKDALYQYRNSEVFNNSRWGKRIKKELCFRYGVVTKDNDLVELIYDDNPATTAVIKDKNDVSHTIVYIPLVKNSDYGNLDRIAFHEMRHVVETDGKRCGIYDFKMGKYDLINEIRTEKHAMDDESYFQDVVFFGKGSSSKRSVYELYVSSCEDFLDNNSDLFDQVAFDGDVAELTYLIGEEYLDSIENQLCNGIIINKSKEMIKNKQ